MLPFVAAVLSGVLLSFAYPPLNLDLLAWVALVPLLILPVPLRLRNRLLTGWLFGAVFFVFSLYWLNEVGFFAGVLLALICAFFPMLWYWLLTASVLHLAGAKAVRPGLASLKKPVHTIAIMLLAAVGWTALEWIRSWIFTGFPWNFLAVSQWQRLSLLQLTTVTGMYGISFLIAAFNVAAAFLLLRWIDRFQHGARRVFPWSMAVMVALVLPIPFLAARLKEMPAADGTMRILAVQGNIPQIRRWTPEEKADALNVYMDLTAAAAPVAQPDLIVWPETAIPSPYRWDRDYYDRMQELLSKIGRPLLIGSIDYRELPANESENEAEDQLQSFNSVFQISPDGEIVEFYDKIHLVPFGEFTPFEQFLPWLTQLIGMGRSLTAGSEFTIFDLPGPAQAGVNVCYEDVFPYISRRFVLNGANLLMTLTNDAWYAESAGSEQHMIHAIFRAVENRRPLFRSGNNSDTCLIMPDGSIEGLLLDPETGNRFVRGVNTYTVPIWDDLGTTFYTIYGDVFAISCAVMFAIIVAAHLVKWFRTKAKLHELFENPRG